MDRHRKGRTLTALGLIGLAVLAGAGPAVAHGTGARLLDLHAHGSAPSTLPGGLGHLSWPLGALLVIGLGLLAGLGWRRVGSPARRRAIAVALSLGLTVFTVETALHSVHHLPAPEAGARCSLPSPPQNLPRGGAAPGATSNPPPHVP